ncbi:hypothetical protein ACH4ZX_12725 [Streptomyces sp. NPDC020490]|uniref:hypothetical protein n=1 Tax=Streptomyces sp. NPDC020490 TaxID=3365078 RepID=UPI0037886C5F
MGAIDTSSHRSLSLPSEEGWAADVGDWRDMELLKVFMGADVELSEEAEAPVQERADLA